MGDGTVRCWGRNLDGQVGDGTTTSPRLAPVAVPGLTSVVAVAVGGNHSCALLDGGGVQCWGDNQFGQLGDLTTTDSPTPRSVLLNTATPSLLTGVVAIAAGTFSTCARTFGGGVQCWGRNNFGQLGINSATDQPSPASALASHVVALAVANHGCIVRSPGTVLCTGGNVSGQIGDGTTTTRLFPTTSTGISTALSVATGAFHTCAIRGSGQALCWGDNAAGQFGDSTTTSRLTPGVGPALGSLTAVTAGGFHTCALDAAGQPFCWGQGGTGVLGDGTFANRLTPVAVPSFSFNIDPDAENCFG